MGKCSVCGNNYDKAMEIKLAPKCNKRSCTIIGHGVEGAGSFYYCAHCANSEGIEEARDRV